MGALTRSRPEEDDLSKYDLLKGWHMGEIDKLVQRNHDFWLGNKTTYLAGPGYREKAENALLEVMNKYFPEKKRKAIDVGCGNGDITLLLSPYFDSIDGYELSPARVQQAQIQNPLPHGIYRAMDIEKETPEGENGSLDAIFLLGVISTVHNDASLARLFKRFYELLAPGALLITRDSLSPRYTYRNPHPGGYFAIYRSLQAFNRLFNNAGLVSVESVPLVKMEQLFNSIYIFKKEGAG